LAAVKLPTRVYETIAVLALLVALALLGWSASERSGVVGAVLGAVGDGDTGWVVALTAGLVAHVLVWAVAMIPLRRLTSKPTLRQEIRDLPAHLGRAMAEQDRRQAAAEQAPRSAAARRHYRILGLAGLGLGAVFALGTGAAVVATGRVPRGPAALAIAGLGLGAWMAIAGRPLPSRKR
jgi:hypothetical protein